MPLSILPKTIVDIVDDPAIGGGIRHVADCLGAYLRREDARSDELIATAEKLGNRAVFKRLGFLVELEGQQDALVAACRARLSAGNAKLDPALPCPKLVKRWHLWIPASYAAKRP